MDYLCGLLMKTMRRRKKKKKKKMDVDVLMQVAADRNPIRGTRIVHLAPTEQRRRAENKPAGNVGSVWKRASHLPRKQMQKTTRRRRKRKKKMRRRRRKRAVGDNDSTAHPVVVQ